MHALFSYLILDLPPVFLVLVHAHSCVEMSPHASPWLHVSLCVSVLPSCCLVGEEPPRVPIFVRRSTLRLPFRPICPIIMVGPGTGWSAHFLYFLLWGILFYSHTGIRACMCGYNVMRGLTSASLLGVVLTCSNASFCHVGALMGNITLNCQN